ncbi:2-hydroxychromene-2-carboxylate isomerase [Micromonospora robiginosa]|uniref:2-hydroxychromene-2-carboxylate isomerase n=1 Tax=Micromonospora robiginosa TaxID=2749844 RepID=A0A7L6B1N3_9ACTN|nr:DsbA family protein [Micromonospora ferruginea]QLQ35893.1 DsbA family protein [Micromonospora ferruginea]
MAPRPPRLYFSFRSPYSWLAVERLTRALHRPQEALEFIPYWDPDPRTGSALTAAGGAFHYVQMSKPKHLYLLQDAKRLARRLEVPMRWPIDIDPWWELPHLGFLAARERGAGEAFYREVIAARWHRGEDVCTPEVLAGVAERAGVDPQVVLGAVDDDAIRAAGVDCLMRAYDDDIFGIPYLRIGPHRFWGFDRVDDFLAAYADRAGAPVRPAEPVPAGAGGYDTDTGGGCG